MKTYEIVYRAKGHCEMAYIIQAATATEAPGTKFFSLREKQEVAA